MVRYLGPEPRLGPAWHLALGSVVAGGALEKIQISYCDSEAPSPAKAGKTAPPMRDLDA